MTAGDITIREAGEADLAAIQAIYAHHVRTGLASFEEVAPDIDEIARRRAAVRERGLPYIVAVAGGEVLGFAYAGPYRPRSAYRFAAEDSVYVSPSAQRRGVGRRLLEALIRRCEGAGIRQIVAVIGDSANRPSIELHRQLGFREAGRLDAIGFKFGRWVDSVIMQRALGEGSTSTPAP